MKLETPYSCLFLGGWHINVVEIYKRRHLAANTRCCPYILSILSSKSYLTILFPDTVEDEVGLEKI